MSAATRPRRVTAAHVVLGLLLLMALELRFDAVRFSVVEGGIRRDAREYVLYAYNLRHFGVYSQADSVAPDAVRPPAPDAIRSPGYPLFLLAMFPDLPTSDDVDRVQKVQALFGTATVLLVFLIGAALLPRSFALAAAALAAISPHLVTMTIYLLSETMLCFWLALALYLLIRAQRSGGRVTWIAAGAALAAAALTHPLMQYAVVPLAAFAALRRIGGSRLAAACLLAGFLVPYGAWVTRNLVTLGHAGDSTLMRAALHNGAYPDLMYQDDSRTYGYPYRADPRYNETSGSVRAIVQEILRMTREDPVRMLRWYTYGKPLTTWGWDNVESQGDVFIYPTPVSPYTFLAHFRWTHEFMHGTHRPLLALMVLGVLLAWWPGALPESARFPARCLSLLLLYHAAIMVAAFPLPRYSLALRPAFYIMALLPLALAARWFPSRTEAADDVDSRSPQRDA